uniref:Uncharacterized protein n=1 Tax=Rhizophora mucronata TaxID=61149 RepID=A0A2P2P1B7_RHIMU
MSIKYYLSAFEVLNIKHNNAIKTNYEPSCYVEKPKHRNSIEAQFRKKIDVGTEGLDLQPKKKKEKTPQM